MRSWGLPARLAGGDATEGDEGGPAGGPAAATPSPPPSGTRERAEAFAPRLSEHHMAQDGPAFAIDGMPDFVPPAWLQDGWMRRRRPARPEHGTITGVNSDEDSEELYREVRTRRPKRPSAV